MCHPPSLGMPRVPVELEEECDCLPRENGVLEESPELRQGDAVQEDPTQLCQGDGPLEDLPLLSQDHPVVADLHQRSQGAGALGDSSQLSVGHHALADLPHRSQGGGAQDNCGLEDLPIDLSHCNGAQEVFPQPCRGNNFLHDSLELTEEDLIRLTSVSSKGDEDMPLLDEENVLGDAPETFSSEHDLSSAQEDITSPRAVLSEEEEYTSLSRLDEEESVLGNGTPLLGRQLSRNGEETLRDIEVLCAERVTQMTKTYNDIDAVTRLLEEKERDLELAARIGQTLLSKNKELASRTEALEEHVTATNDKLNQLRHDLCMKDELLRIYNEDYELQHPGQATPEEGAPDGNLDFFQKKVSTLEEENLNLRLETAKLKADTDSFEDKEKKLVEDCIQQLSEVNSHVETLAEELHHKVEENSHQKEELTQQLTQITEMQKKIRKMTLDNMDLHEKLTASTESQRKLTKELGSMQDKYDELFEMMEEAQDELRLMRSRHKVKATGKHHHSAYGIPTDSLASELETSLQQELSQSNRRAQSWKIFETAKAAKRAAAKAERERSSSSFRMSVSVASSHRDSDTASQGLPISACASDVESFNSDGYSGDLDSLYGSNPELGRPGIPGSNDLESALRRLAMRRANELNEKDFLEEEEERKRQAQLKAMSGATTPQSLATNSGLRSPSSVGSFMDTPVGSTSGGAGYKISDKLQIVKPLEGSMTLRHWQHLATPHLGGIFEPRDGVQMKGEKKLDLVEEVYSLSDFEEDDDPQDVFTRKEQDSGMVYTLTDSTVSTLGGQYRGLGSLFDTSRNSSFGNLVNTSFNAEELPVHTSSPAHMAQKQPMVIGPHQHNAMQGGIRTSGSLTSSESHSSSYTMSLGLAALLQGREHTGLGQSIMRATASQSNLSKIPDSGPPGGPPSGAAALNSSSPSSVVSRSSGPLESPRLFASHSMVNLPTTDSSTDGVTLATPPSATSLRGLPGSRSMQEAIREYSQEKSEARVGESGDGTFPPGMTGQGFLQQLKNKGLSLYGLWGGSSSTSKTNSDPSDLSQGPIKSGSAPEEPSPPSVADSVFDNGAGGGAGVLGALTNFRRNGIF